MHFLIDMFEKGNLIPKICCFVVVDDKKKLNAVIAPNEDTSNNDQLEAWTAHKTEAGIIYYYNAMTGESTYDKPAGFIGEVLILGPVFFADPLQYCVLHH